MFFCFNNSGGTPEQDWYDPSEPRYCICNQVSYGDMVACDNEDVSLSQLLFDSIFIYSQKLCGSGLELKVLMYINFVSVSIRMVSLSLCWY